MQGNRSAHARFPHTKSGSKEGSGVKKTAVRLSKMAVVATALILSLLSVLPVSAQEQEEPTVIEPRQAELELQLTYAHSSSNKLHVHGYSIFDAIIIGELQIHKVKRDILIPSLVLRLGLSEKTALEVLVPFSYRRDDILKTTHMTDDGQPTRQVLDASGIGDVEVVLSHGGVVGSAKVPVVSTLALKTPTGLSPYDAPEDRVALGTGHWGARLGFTTTKVLDPLVLFGTVSYTWNFSRELDGYGLIDPGDSFGYSVGAAYAVTPRLSISTRLEQQFTSPTTRNEVFEPGTESTTSSFYVGASYELKSGITLDVSVGLGLTEDSPDFTLNLTRVLYRF